MNFRSQLRAARHRLDGRARAIAQTAVAAVIAWYVSVLLLPDPQPAFACIAAVIAIGASYGAQRARALQLVAGVVTGLAVADLIVHLIGTGAPQLGLMVVLAMSVAVLLNGSELVISEAAVSAMLLMLTAPAGDGFSPNRILEATIGGAVALVVALLSQPDPILPVNRAAQAVFGRLGRALEDTAAALDAGDTADAEQALAGARSIEGLLRELDEVLDTSREAVRVAPRHFADRESIDRYGRSLRQVDLAVRNTRVLARHSLRAIRAGDTPTELRDAVAGLADAVWTLAAAYEQPERAAEARAKASAAALEATTVAAAGGLTAVEVAAPVRSAAVDLMRAADYVAGTPDEPPPTEELLVVTRPA